MLKNYLKIALRGLLNHKLFSLINVCGLAVGIACAILIGLFVMDEFSFDRYHTDYERIYRISRDFYQTEVSPESLLATNAPQAAATLEEDFPEIETTVRLYGGGRALLSRENVSYCENSLLFADDTLFRIFTFDWIEGDPATALVSPLSVVLTESAARKYFGDGDPLGETLLLENAVPLKVTGVIADLPHNTHLKAEAFVPMKAIEPVLGESFMHDWNNTSFHTYVKLKPGADIETLTRQFPEFLNRHVAEDASDWSGLTAMNIADIHLETNKQLELSPPGNLGTVYTFAAVAFCVLIIACFNFMNLSTARSSLRLKEVGVRKYIGAQKGQLIGQFIGESVLLAVMATVFALALVELLLPAFNQFIGKPLEFNLAGDLRVQASMVGLVLFVGLFAGSYPAFYLSSFNAANILRGTLGAGSKGSLLFRNCLVVLQFSASIALVIATAVVLLQMNFARNIELGFRKDRIVTLTGSPTSGLGSQWDAMRRELLGNPEITQVTGSNILPFEENLSSYTTLKEGNPQALYMSAMMVDYDFFETYDIGLLSGRTFTEDFPADRWNASQNGESSATGNFILNESAARAHGWSPAEAIGNGFETIYNGRHIKGRIVGVVSDSYFESVHFAIKPMVFILTPSTNWGLFPTLSHASIRITGNDVQGTLDYIDRTWQSFQPDFPVVRRFLDEDFTSVYLDEDRQGEMLVYFTTLAILIACLGLFGLASFNTQRRMKEIGIRKVMGSSVWGIVTLLTYDFSRLVLLANVIAWPVAYFAMNRWLSNFAYRIDLTPLIFIGSGLIALCIAWVTVGGTAAKAASQRPVVALRYE